PASCNRARTASLDLAFRSQISTRNSLASASVRFRTICRMNASSGCLVHVEIPPNDEVSRVSRGDLFLQYIGRGMESASAQRGRLIAAGIFTRPPRNPSVIDDEQTWFGLSRQGRQLLRRHVIPCTKRTALFGHPGKEVQRSSLVNQHVTTIA